MAQQVTVFHDVSLTFLDKFVEMPSHALIIEGDAGTGTRYAAEYVLKKLGLAETDRLIVEPEGNSISIDVIRPLYRLTKSVRDTRLAVLIDNAELMGDDAQNSLLKLLEEPPSNVLFILTSHNAERLLPTIRSRSVVVSLRHVTSEQSRAFLDEFSLDNAKKQRIMFLAAGRIAELARLANDAEYYDANVIAIGAAKDFLEADTYGRLVRIKQYATNRDTAMRFLEMLSVLVSHMLYKDPSAHIVITADAIQEALSRLERNGNARAQLLMLCQKLT